MPTPFHRGSRALLDNIASPISLYFIIYGMVMYLGNRPDIEGALDPWQVHIWALALITGGVATLIGTAARKVRLETVGHIITLWGLGVFFLLMLFSPFGSGTGLVAILLLSAMTGLRLRQLHRQRKAERDLRAGLLERGEV